MLVGVGGIGGLHLELEVYEFCCWFYLGFVCLLHLNLHPVVGSRCAKGDAWVESTNLLNALLIILFPFDMISFPPGLASLHQW